MLINFKGQRRNHAKGALYNHGDPQLWLWIFKQRPWLVCENNLLFEQEPIAKLRYSSRIFTNNRSLAVSRNTKKGLRYVCGTKIPNPNKQLRSKRPEGYQYSDTPQDRYRKPAGITALLKHITSTWVICYKATHITIPLVGKATFPQTARSHSSRNTIRQNQVRYW